MIRMAMIAVLALVPASAMAQELIHADTPASERRAKPAVGKPRHPAPARKPAETPLDQESEHIVRPGETLGGVAQRAHVPRVLIIEANHLTEPYAVKAGQKLFLPRTRHHRVKAGETGFDIAYRYGVPFSSIAVANGLKADANLQAGQDLLIPSLMHPTATTPARVPDENTPAKRADDNPPADKPKSRKASKSTDDGATDRADDAPELAIPLAGPVRRGFHARNDADPHDGVDITAPAGAAVRAAADGKVIFAGPEPQSFGNLVVVDHGHGWQTAYGFLSKITVAQGDSIRARERLGLVGRSGKATRDELHFEVRHANMPVDPLAYMPRLGRPGPAAKAVAGDAPVVKPAKKPAAKPARKGRSGDTPLLD